MSPAFGKKKPAAPRHVHVREQAGLQRPDASDPRVQATGEAVQAFYRITHTRPSRLERVRMMRQGRRPI